MTHGISVGVSDDERQRLLAAAALAGTSMSEVLRNAAGLGPELRAVSPEIDDDLVALVKASPSGVLLGSGVELIVRAWHHGDSRLRPESLPDGSVVPWRLTARGQPVVEVAFEDVWCRWVVLGAIVPTGGYRSPVRLQAREDGSYTVGGSRLVLWPAEERDGLLEWVAWQIALGRWT